MYIERFFNYLQYEKRFSPHTLLSYRKDIDQFLHFIQGEPGIRQVQDITHHTVRSWLVELMEQRRSAATVSRKLSSLRTYFKFLLREGIIRANPAVKIQGPKAGKKLPVFIRRQAMDHLLDDLEFEDTFEGVRDKAILETFYQTGMRLSELINLREDDVDIFNSRIRVVGKRNKERLIPFSSSYRVLIREYLQLKKLQNPDNKQGALFVKKKGEKLPARFVYKLVNKYLSMVSTEDKKSPHVLRHTFATHMLNNGADLNAVKELLGHASLAATQVYTHNSTEHLKKIYKQAHPKAGT